MIFDYSGGCSSALQQRGAPRPVYIADAAAHAVGGVYLLAWRGASDGRLLSAFRGRGRPGAGGAAWPTQGVEAQLGAHCVHPTHPPDPAHTTPARPTPSPTCRTPAAPSPTTWPPLSAAPTSTAS